MGVLDVSSTHDKSFWQNGKGAALTVQSAEVLSSCSDHHLSNAAYLCSGKTLRPTIIASTGPREGGKKKKREGMWRWSVYSQKLEMALGFEDMNMVKREW
jgi:hypothetical protein